jgi:hypothetical protein
MTCKFVTSSNYVTQSPEIIRLASFVEKYRGENHSMAMAGMLRKPYI